MSLAKIVRRSIHGCERRFTPPELKRYVRERFFTPKVFGKIWRLYQRPMWWALDKYRRLRDFLRLPDYRGMRLTPKRLLNLYLVRFQKGRGHVKLYGSPIVLTIESTNACNLRCPYCFTGAGEIGRDKNMLPLLLYQKALDEMGSRLLQVEFYNWGEPLLNKSIYDMVRMASDRGISTIISTNFSFPFDQERAEKLVASQLSVLGVSLDGAWQESYEQYRVRGDLETVLRNVQMVNDAKQKLGSKNPHMIWEYHIFPHNKTKEEIETARQKAQELGMEFALSKGWVAGEDWDKTDEFRQVLRFFELNVSDRIGCDFFFIDFGSCSETAGNRNSLSERSTRCFDTKLKIAGRMPLEPGPEFAQRG